MIARQRMLKSLLWAIVGCLAVVTIARFKNGLGSTTNLTDFSPWGLWIAFDVMAGVALAAGGFVLAATVHIFHLERYHGFVRPAILTALLGYMAVAVGLLYDLGLPWHIWHLVIYPQPHSVLFEVGMCVMLYLTVLILEFSPVILEHPALQKPLFRTIRNVLTRFTIPLVIAGIVLSTLHQSSLGSLFLITPYRLHDLWYSPIIWILYFVSAVGLGLMTVILESYFSAWFFGHKLRMDLLSGLARAATFVFLAYLALRLGDLAMRGAIGGIFEGSFESWIFLLEIAMSALIPAILLSMKRVRTHPKALGWIALMSVLGIIGYRFDVCLVAFQRPDGMPYFPSWTELAVTLGIVAGAMLVFIAFVEKLHVLEHDDEEEEEGAVEPKRSYAPNSFALILPEAVAGPRRYSLAALTGAALAVAFLPTDAIWGPQPMTTPVSAPRVVEGLVQERPGEFGHELSIARVQAAERGSGVNADLMLIDGNRDGRLVLFNHDGHEAELGGDQSCVLCHHQELPFQEHSRCSDCHSDMYLVTDTFDHGKHVVHMEGNEGCVRCHEDAALPKTRATARACQECHADMLVEGSRVAAPEEGLTGLAPGYMTAMHELCVKCHEEKVLEDPARYPESFAECASCHRDESGATLRTLAPYVLPEAAVEGSELSARAEGEAGDATSR